MAPVVQLDCSTAQRSSPPTLPGALDHQRHAFPLPKPDKAKEPLATATPVNNALASDEDLMCNYCAMCFKFRSFRKLGKSDQPRSMAAATVEGPLLNGQHPDIARGGPNRFHEAIKNQDSQEWIAEWKFRL